ncbi:MAG: hypothetical protein CL524_13370 [Aequorivita sp.]|nr:hypothetical protein [Aequorivita sp.]MBF31131.1 hypothetical protein [Aequorivita sp.]|tara:strand:+ start:22049 stop:23176 length:1128 start_codon:yes stop_codon:yes gene_type:complete
MEYIFVELSITDLIELIDHDNIDLNPEYQRNFIWSPKDQSELIDTILKGYPLPSFFMYDGGANKEMVDGQQRSKTIYRFIKGDITSSKETGRVFFQSFADSERILNYKLPFVIIVSNEKKETLRDFYVLINKKGKNLNIPEVHKSEFFDTNFMKLANSVLDYQNFIDLNLFKEVTATRMNDRDYVQELLVYLKLGIRDKKTDVVKIFEEDIDEIEFNELKERFESIIDIIKNFNNIEPISKTRYKQKNDFYTLFCFVDKNIDQDINLFNYQYKTLLILNGRDNEGRQFIRPTNEDCESLREYARNCVTQSNSKEARDKRLAFFNSILKNKNYKENEIFIDVWRYLSTIYGFEKINLVKKGEYELMDIEPLNHNLF